jgi:hypothetical protein
MAALARRELILRILISTARTNNPGFLAFVTHGCQNRRSKIAYEAFCEIAVVDWTWVSQFDC